MSFIMMFLNLIFKILREKINNIFTHTDYALFRRFWQKKIQSILANVNKIVGSGRLREYDK